MVCESVYNLCDSQVEIFLFPLSSFLSSVRRASRSIRRVGVGRGGAEAGRRECGFLPGPEQYGRGRGAGERV